MNNKIVVNSEDAPAPIGPYSQAVGNGTVLYISGQVAIDPRTNQLIDGDVVSETHQVMKNLGAILKKAGLTYEHVFKCSIFVKNMDHFAKINEAYGSYFGDQPPARETVEVSRLPKDVGVEISCIAHR